MPINPRHAARAIGNVEGGMGNDKVQAEGIFLPEEPKFSPDEIILPVEVKAQPEEFIRE